MTPEQVGDVVGDDRSAILVGVSQQDTVVDAAQMGALRLLYRHYVVSVGSEVLGDDPW